MLLGLLADAHGNIEALQRAVDRLAPHVELFVFAGDAFSDHRFSNECVALLRSIDAACVLGNHELSLLGPTGARAREAPYVESRHLAWVRALPVRAELHVGGRRIDVFHSTPVSPFDRYVTPSSPWFSELDALSADLVVVGHAHERFAARAATALVINPGAVGRAEDHGAPGVFSAAVVDLTTLDVEFVDVEPACDPRPS